MDRYSDHGYRQNTPGYQEYAEKARKDIAPWLAPLGSQMPIIGDTVGLLSDVQTLKEEWPDLSLLGKAGGTGMAALGALPFIPGGLLGSVGGIQDKLADTDMYLLAKEAAKKGLPMDKVEAATGWRKDPIDKRWKFEIDDSEAEPSFDFYGSLDNETTLEGPLSSILDHDKLYANNPELANIPTKATVSRGLRSIDDAGSFYPVTKEVEVLAGTTERLKSKLLHEAGHATQKSRNFEGGTSPEAVEGRLWTPPFLDRTVDTIDSKRRLRNLSNASDRAAAEYNWDAYDAIRKRLDRLTAFEMYKNKSGEAEARVIEQRMNLTPDDRRMSPMSSAIDREVPEQLRWRW